jgi:hypothetical protein
MGLKPDHWIRKMALEHGMIEPFVDRQVREGVISYGVSSYGYDIRVANEFKIFTNVFSATVDPKHFAAELVCVGAYGGIFSCAAQGVDGLFGEVDLCALRDYRQCDAFRAGVGRVRDIGNFEYHTTTCQDLCKRRAGAGVIL